MVDSIRGLVASLPLLDVFLNGAQFLTIAADQLLTPMILFSFTILPNLNTPANLAWVQQTFVALVVVFAVVVLLNSAENAIQKWRRKNGTE